MSEKKHTPGPLVVRVAPHPESGQSRAQFTEGLLRLGPDPLFVVVAEDPERPAPDYLVTAVTGDGPSSRANAILYAAAPDLLEAAKRAQCQCSILERDSGHLVDCWMPDLSEAIAKAEPL
jgi:hypothetical protein